MTKEEREDAIRSVRMAFSVWESEYDTGEDWSGEHKARDRAIEALKKESILDKANYQRCAEEHKQLTEWLKELKQLRKQTGWIPVTEDAPPIGTICLWCNKQGSVFTSEITYRSERNSYIGKHGYFSNTLENYGDIVAWMPLPEPYKGSEEE